MKEKPRLNNSRSNQGSQRRTVPARLIGLDPPFQRITRLVALRLVAGVRKFEICPFRGVRRQKRIPGSSTQYSAAPGPASAHRSNTYRTLGYYTSIFNSTSLNTSIRITSASASTPATHSTTLSFLVSQPSTRALPGADTRASNDDPPATTPSAVLPSNLEHLSCPDTPDAAGFTEHTDDRFNGALGSAPCSCPPEPRPASLAEPRIASRAVAVRPPIVRPSIIRHPPCHLTRSGGIVATQATPLVPSLYLWTSLLLPCRPAVLERIRVGQGGAQTATRLRRQPPCFFSTAVRNVARAATSTTPRRTAAELS